MSSQGVLQDDLRQIEQNVKHVFAFFLKKKNEACIYLYVHACICIHAHTVLHLYMHRIRLEENTGNWQGWFSPGELWGFHYIYSLYF